MMKVDFPEIPVIKSHNLVQCTINVDVDHLTEILQGIMGALRAQTDRMDKVDSEMQKRRMEMDIFMRNCTEDIRKKMIDEARAREMHDGKLQKQIDELKSSMGETQTELGSKIEANRELINGNTGTLQSALDKLKLEVDNNHDSANTSLKAAEATMQQTVKDGLKKVQDVQNSTDSRVSNTMADINALYTLMSLRRDEVSQANISGTQAQLLHGTPAFRILKMHDGQQDQQIDAILDRMRQAEKTLGTKAAKDAIEQELSTVTAMVKKQYEILLEAIKNGDDNTLDQSRSILDQKLEDKLNLTVFNDKISQMTTKAHVDTEIADKVENVKIWMQEHVHNWRINHQETSTNLDNIKEMLQLKADFGTVVKKADVIDVDKQFGVLDNNHNIISKKILEMGDNLSCLQDELDSLKRRVAPAVALAAAGDDSARKHQAQKAGNGGDINGTANTSGASQGKDSADMSKLTDFNKTALSDLNNKLHKLMAENDIMKREKITNRELEDALLAVQQVWQAHVQELQTQVQKALQQLQQQAKAAAAAAGSDSTGGKRRKSHSKEGKDSGADEKDKDGIGASDSEPESTIMMPAMPIVHVLPHSHPTAATSHPKGDATGYTGGRNSPTMYIDDASPSQAHLQLHPHFKYDPAYVDSEPATMLRFRCLSCNRVAGPLTEPYKRTPGAQNEFPPQSVFVQSSAKPVQSQTENTPSHVPAKMKKRPNTAAAGTTAAAGGGGAAGTGSVMGGSSTAATSQITSNTNILPSQQHLQSATRKKLQNYYEWLACRNQERHPNMSPSTVTMGTTPSNANFQPSTRSTSPPPGKAIIGKDGRFYAGVMEKPSYLHQVIFPEGHENLEIDLAFGDDLVVEGTMRLAHPDAAASGYEGGLAPPHET